MSPNAVYPHENKLCLMFIRAGLLQVAVSLPNGALQPEPEDLINIINIPCSLLASPAADGGHTMVDTLARRSESARISSCLPERLISQIRALVSVIESTSRYGL